MQVVNKKMCVIVILVLVIIESCTLFLMYKSYSNKNTNLDEVNLNINNSNMFAIMLEQEDGTYKEDTSSTWPTSGYAYNASMSGCIDINGNKLDGVLSYDSTNNIATVDTGNTSYCYLYFSIPKWCNEDETASECLLRNPTSGLNTTNMEGEMYRYHGNSNNNDIVNNYVCFGTNNKSTCTNNTDKYMYRILGVNSSGQLKLIKREPINNTAYAWHKTEEKALWADSDIFKGLNGISGGGYSNLFVNSSNYDYMNTSSVWYNKISNTIWKYGEISNRNSANVTPDEIYALENSFSNSVNAKVGVMYIHDYYYLSGANCFSSCDGSWVLTTPRVDELLMDFSSYVNGGVYFELNTPLYTSGKVFSSWVIGASSLGGVGPASYYKEGSLREGTYVKPVFYIESTIHITGGTGTETDPFIIN